MYGLARVDRSGRVADRTVTGALGWRGGDQLTLTAEAGMVVIRRDSSGLVTIISQRHNRHVTSDCLGQPAPSRNVTGRLKNGRARSADRCGHRIDLRLTGDHTDQGIHTNP